MIFSYRFIKGLIEGHVDAPRLLEQLSIRISSTRNTRLQSSFYISISWSHFAKNAP